MTTLSLRRRAGIRFFKSIFTPGAIRRFPDHETFSRLQMEANGHHYKGNPM
jgi:hypothetical protein